MRCFVLLCALLFTACASTVGASVTVEEAETQMEQIRTSLDHALALHSQGYLHDAKTQWGHARTAYNTRLRAGIAYHNSPKEALQISVLLGQIAAELDATKGTPEHRVATLKQNVDRSIRHIPSATPDPVILARQDASVPGEAQQTARLQTETVQNISR